MLVREVGSVSDGTHVSLRSVLINKYQDFLVWRTESNYNSGAALWPKTEQLALCNYMNIKQGVHEKCIDVQQKTKTTEEWRDSRNHWVISWNTTKPVGGIQISTHQPQMIPARYCLFKNILFCYHAAHTWTLTSLQLMISTMPTTSSNTRPIFLQLSGGEKQTHI